MIVYWVCNKRLLYKIKFSRYLLKLIYHLIFLLLSTSLNLTDIYCRYSLSTYNLKVNTLRKSLQTTSALPCRTQVQPATSFLVCSLIFVEYNLRLVSWFALWFLLIKRNAPPRWKSIFYFDSHTNISNFLLVLVYHF